MKLPRTRRRLPPACRAVALACATAFLISFPLLRGAEPIGPADLQPDPIASWPTLESSALVAEVMKRNPELLSKAHAAHASDAEIDGARALPPLTLRYAVAPGTLLSDSEAGGHVVSLTQLLPTLGTLDLQDGVAQRQAESTRARHAATAQTLAWRARILAEEWSLVHRSLAIHEHHLSLASALIERAEASVRASQGGLQDPIQAEAVYIDLRQDGLALQRQLQVIRSALNRLLHRAPGAPFPPPEPERDVERLPAVEELFQVALVNRPELKAKAAQVATAELQLDLARRARLPQVGLSVGANTLWGQSTKWMTMGATVSVPSRRGTSAAVEAQSARLAEARAALEAEVDRVMEEVERAWHEANEAIEAAELIGSHLIPVSEERLAVLLEGYRAGIEPFWLVVDAENALYRAELRFEELKSRARVHHVDLALATGRLAAGEVLR